MKRNLAIGTTLAGLLVALAIAQGILEKRADAQAGNGGKVQVPRFEVDPTFPKPMPNHWYQGMSIGVGVDANDHVWIVHRPDTVNALEAAETEKTGACCQKAPPILEFDQQGNLLRHWGGADTADYKWPASNHGITVDHKGNVWIGGNGQGDGMVLKFTQDGKFLLKVGDKGVPLDSNSTEHFGMVAKIFVDAKENEAYIADGYGNKRVAVIDADTGKFKRYWGAYGNKPDDTNLGRYNPDAPPAQQFRTPVHCAEMSKDRFVYVCDRVNDRIQVFTPEGKFVKEAWVSKRTLGDGSTWDIAFSDDPQQKFIYLADGHDEKVWILDRQSLEILTSFGDGGKMPGQFYAVHSIATDSKGNIYTTETYDGRRLQRFLYKGMQTVTKGEDQGTVWPKTKTQ
jgi:DNA-binding beta-propeller fold protein YncE